MLKTRYVACRALMVVVVANLCSFSGKADVWVVYPPSLTCDINGVNVPTSGVPPLCLATHASSQYTDQFTAHASCLDCTYGGVGVPSAYVIVTVGASAPCSVSVATNYIGGTITSGTNGVYAESQSKVGGGPWGYNLSVSTNCTGQTSMSGGNPPGQTNPC